MITFELKKKNLDPCKQEEYMDCDILTAIEISPNISTDEIIDLVKRDFISKINLIQLAYPNLHDSLSTYEIISKFYIKDTYIDNFDEYCLGCLDFPSINHKLFGSGEWPIFYVRIHKVHDRLKDSNNILTYWITR